MSYLVLVLNVLSERSSLDLSLLASVISVMEPPAKYSPLIRSVLSKCRKLYEFAESVTNQHLEGSFLLEPRSTSNYLNELILSGVEGSDSARALASWDIFSTDLNLDTVWKPI